MIINSMIDQDLYKLSMQQVVFHKFPDVNVEFEFKLRNYPPGTLTPYINRIQKEIDHLCTLRFKCNELKYLRQSPFISDGYTEFLRNFQLHKKFIDVTKGNDRYLRIWIHGSWLNTILFEVPVLAIVSEVFFESKKVDPYVEGEKRLQDKIEIIQKYNKDIERDYKDSYNHYIKIADFGTRRRSSREWQDYVVGNLVNKLPRNIVGTSNVYLARKYCTKPIGTMAHEFIQAMQAMVRLSDSQKFAFETWAQEYRGRLGIALSDTLGMNAFFNDFDLYFAKLFDGARHDSGNPYEWCNKLILHYKQMKIDPKTKTAVFSDGLDFQKAINLHRYYNESINTSFGIGTNITNDVGIKPPQIVIKMTRCNNRPVAKISDSPGKQMCTDKEYLKYLASVFNISKERVNQ